MARLTRFDPDKVVFLQTGVRRSGRPGHPEARAVVVDDGGVTDTSVGQHTLVETNQPVDLRQHRQVVAGQPLCSEVSVIRRLRAVADAIRRKPLKIQLRRWLAGDSMQPYGSFGNGAAMRVAPAGLLATTLEDAIALAHRVTEVTHDHPEGMRGAAATAVAIWAARQGADAETIRAEIAGRFGYKLLVTVDQIRPGYIFNETCIDTVPQAITCALEATSYEDAIRNAISIGGDSDTVAAIAGGIAEAMFGVPDTIALTAWERLPDDMRAVLSALYARAGRGEVFLGQPASKGS